MQIKTQQSLDSENHLLEIKKLEEGTPEVRLKIQRLEQLEAEETKIKNQTYNASQMNKIIDLNISGVFLQVQAIMFQEVKYSLLWKLMVDPKQDQIHQGKIFINRDPAMFQLLINFIRYGMKEPIFRDQNEQIMFSEELRFWNIRVPCEIERELREIFKNEPKGLTERGLVMWRKLGPFNLNDIFEKFEDF